MDKIIFSKISTAEILLNQKKVASGSIINIKNLKFSFLLINNTFSTNVGWAGTAVYINGFESGT